MTDRNAPFLSDIRAALEDYQLAACRWQRRILDPAEVGPEPRKEAQRLMDAQHDRIMDMIQRWGDAYVERALAALYEPLTAPRPDDLRDFQP